MAPCFPDDAKQRFEFGPCSSDGYLTVDPTSQHMNATRGAFTQPFCLIHSQAASSKSGCLDVERESVKSGAKVISFACRKTKWNQLFSFGPNGSIFLNIPLSQHRDKRMCLQTDSWAPHSHLHLAPCDDAEELQRFYFFDNI